jgi:hypothetical protein
MKNSVKILLGEGKERMSMLYLKKKLQPVLAMAALGLLALLAAACSDGAATLPSNTSTTLNSALNNAQSSASGLQVTSEGTALLTWNPVTQSLTVSINVAGLPPDSTHPAHIHLGNCSMMGNILYPLNNVVADNQGQYNGTTIIQKVKNGIPATGWYVNIHHGPGLADATQMAPIACGNIVNPDPKPDHVEAIKVPFSMLFINQFATVNKIASTVPGNGDVNPYGTAIVQQSNGKLLKGDILVSNFNNSQNNQGTGTTIVQISPDGQQSVFAQLNGQACPDGIGLTTALVELKRGWVIVGSLPTGDGQFAHAKAGCLIVLNSQGQVAATWRNGQINGPWDATAQEDNKGDDVTLFVSNVLNGNLATRANQTVNQGNVVRFELNVPEQGQGTPRITASRVIATGIGELTDGKAALQGPTGLGLAANGTLYVADTVNSRVLMVQNALNRTTFSDASKHILSTGGKLNGELGLTIAPNGDILTVNGNDGNLVEITPAGVQIAVKQLSNTANPGMAPGAGCLFNLAVAPNGAGLYFVDDCTNQLNIFH